MISLYKANGRVKNSIKRHPDLPPEKDSAAIIPFVHYHYFVPEVDEDYTDPYPNCIRPLRFILDYLYKWQAELGTKNQNTHRLYRGEDIDGRDA
jgi:hypothetical protein